MTKPLLLFNEPNDESVDTLREYLVNQGYTPVILNCMFIKAPKKIHEIVHEIKNNKNSFLILEEFSSGSYAFYNEVTKVIDKKIINHNLIALSSIKKLSDIPGIVKARFACVRFKTCHQLKSIKFGYETSPGKILY